MSGIFDDLGRAVSESNSDFVIYPLPSDNEAVAKLEGKILDAKNMATYATRLLDLSNDALTRLFNTEDIEDLLQDLTAAIDDIGEYVAPASLTFEEPIAPTFTDIPSYTSPTLGTIYPIPDVEEILIGDAPSTDISFDNEVFSDTLADTLKSKLESDLSTASTGLGDAEAALFARETARQNAARLVAYNEITSQFSARGFDMPPGALLAKQTEMNNESNIRLSDSSSQIMAESAKLAQAWNQTTVTVSAQFVDVLARVLDARVMRDYEAAKNSVMMAIEGFKQEVLAATTKAELNAKLITSTVAYNDGTVKVFLGEVEGQTAPMKAIADTNKAAADYYDAAVKAATGKLQAQVIPEDLKLRALEANTRLAIAKGDLVSKEVTLALDAALRTLQLQATTLQSKAQAAAQLAASALNSVNASISVGDSFSVSNNAGASASISA